MNPEIIMYWKNKLVTQHWKYIRYKQMEKTDILFRTKYSMRFCFNLTYPIKCNVLCSYGHPHCHLGECTVDISSKTYVIASLLLSHYRCELQEDISFAALVTSKQWKTEPYHQLHVTLRAYSPKLALERPYSIRDHGVQPCTRTVP